MMADTTEVSNFDTPWGGVRVFFYDRNTVTCVPLRMLGVPAILGHSVTQICGPFA
jgi:hypothetical protein